jgi:hypothetical protein
VVAEEDGQDRTSKWSAPRDLPPADPNQSARPVHEHPAWHAAPSPQPPPPHPGPHRPLWPVAKPASHGLYVSYAFLMCLLYVGCTAVGLWLLQSDLDMSGSRYTSEDAEAQAIGLVVVGVPLALLFGIAPLLPKRPWSWVYGLVMIIIGLTSCCTWPLTIPLLIRWFRPEIKAYYRKG